MHLGIAGYVATDTIAPLLDGDAARLPSGFPGAPFFGTLIAAQLARGYEVSVFTPTKDVPAGAEPVVARGRGLTVYYCAYRPRHLRPNGRYPGRMLDFFRVERAALRRAMLRAAPDLVHAHWTYECALAAIESGLPHVVTCHDSPARVLAHARDHYRLFMYFMARRALARARCLTAVSPYMRDEVRSLARVPITVVPNPLAPLAAEIGPRDPRPVARAAPRIAMICNGWIALKNPKRGFEAFGLLRARAPAAELHVYGTGYGPGGPAEAWARAADLARGVHFHGERSHAALLGELRTHDVLLHPSLEESFGVVLAEAMALGLPVVAGKASGAVPWVTGDGAAGVLTDVTDPERIRDALVALVEDPARYAACVAAGRARVRGAFEAASVAQAYESVYRGVLAGRLSAGAPVTDTAWKTH